jgi:hypothetical protein
MWWGPRDQVSLNVWGVRHRVGNLRSEVVEATSEKTVPYHSSANFVVHALGGADKSLPPAVLVVWHMQHEEAMCAFVTICGSSTMQF